MRTHYAWGDENAYKIVVRKFEGKLLGVAFKITLKYTLKKSYGLDLSVS